MYNLTFTLGIAITYCMNMADKATKFKFSDDIKAGCRSKVVKGGKKGPDNKNHSSHILSMAVTSDGKFLVRTIDTTDISLSLCFCLNISPLQLMKGKFFFQTSCLSGDRRCFKCNLHLEYRNDGQTTCVPRASRTCVRSRIPPRLAPAL